MLLRQRVGVAEGELVPVMLTLGEREEIPVEHTVGVRDALKVPLNEGEQLPEGDTEAVGHCERVAEAHSEGVSEGLPVPQEEGERVSDGLFDRVGVTLCVLEEDTLPEVVVHPVAVPLSDGETLPEGDTVAVGHCDRVTEAPVERVCKGLTVPHEEGVSEGEGLGDAVDAGETDDEKVPLPAPSPALALGEDEKLALRVCVTDGDCDCEAPPVALTVLQGEPEIVLDSVAVRQAVPLTLGEEEVVLLRHSVGEAEALRWELRERLPVTLCVLDSAGLLETEAETV